jgi:hypothetical protein
MDACCRIATFGPQSRHECDWLSQINKQTVPVSQNADLRKGSRDFGLLIDSALTAMY